MKYRLCISFRTRINVRQIRHLLERLVNLLSLGHSLRLLYNPLIPERVDLFDSVLSILLLDLGRLTLEVFHLPG